jgi:hypothetical protein
MNKYRNIPTTIGGIRFDSKKEAARYMTLKTLERVGKISDLQLQPSFDLIDTMYHEERTLRKIVYKADFMYKIGKDVIVEDAKGKETKVFKIKMRLFLAKYPQYVFKIT